ncbi:MAG: FtsQ-type POTRA domain-containing protein [Gemmatimonadetes bacterium]|nr:FtsQ-type POTRA domain-containing protein [Gemmatimonadota bacterium]
MSAAAGRWLLVVAATVLATGGAVLAPRVLRRMDSFHVQQVEVTGARYLSAPEAVAASGIGPTSSVFGNFDQWRAARLRHPLVQDVRITRRLPFTIVLQVTETRPLAFAQLPALRPVDARGRLLEIDPAREPLDLPLLAAAPGVVAGAVTDPAALRALAVLGRVAQLEPALFALTSEVTPLAEGVKLIVREPAGAQLLLPDAPAADQLHLLRLALADVQGERPNSAAVGEPRLRRIDARYREQIVVALTPNQSR